MPKLLIMYPNKIFLEFIKKYLTRIDYEVVCGYDGASLYNTTAKILPDVVMIGRNLPGLELNSFLFKKKVSKTIKFVRVYLIGDFSTKEIIDLKQYEIEAYVSSPVNPVTLVERLNTTFRISKNSDVKSTPMLVDIHVKGKIFVLQIEANLEPDKIDIMNFKIRSYCAKNKIKDPRFFYIIPSMYPETVHKENLDILFSATKYPEFKVITRQVKILTKNAHFINTLKSDEVYSEYETVPDYIYGIERLNIDFDNMKQIPVNYLTPGCTYMLDLYDHAGEMRVPARTSISEEIIEYYKSIGLHHLVYYSSKDLSELVNDNSELVIKDDIDIASSFLNQSDEMADDTIVNDNLDEKMKLFFNKIKGLGCLVISPDKEERDFMRTTLEETLNVSVELSGIDIERIISENKFIMIFISIESKNPNALEILSNIRKIASRRKTTVVILAKHIDAITIARLKKIGTDYVIVSPFTRQKIKQQVFKFVTQDREN